jgi:hypothetical protein
MPKQEALLDAFADLKLEILRSPIGFGMIAARANVTRATIYYWLRGSRHYGQGRTCAQQEANVGGRRARAGAARRGPRNATRIALWSKIVEV